MAIIQELCPELKTAPQGTAPAHQAACPSCAISSPCDSAISRAAAPGRKPWPCAQTGARGRGLPPRCCCRQARRVQHAVYLRHHRLPQGRHAHPLQRGEQRQGHRRLHGPLHRRQDDDSGAHVPLLRHGAGHDRLHDPRRHHVPHPGLLAPRRAWTASTRSRSPASTACPPCLSPCWATRTSPTRISATCAPASWRAAPAPSR